MITGTHALIHSDHAEEIRAFFRDVLKFSSVDAGHGWLIFSLPPAELGIHPAEKGSHYEMYLMCDEIKSTVADLERNGVKFSAPITEARFGSVTSITLPGGAELGLYQPRHPLAPAWPAAAKKTRTTASRKTSKPRKARPRRKRR
ncbi:MAG: VOC family protein [Candidatus Acidiferrales bacterium]